MIPTGGDTPSRYRPNAADDRGTGNTDMYRALAAAIEEIETLRAPGPAYAALDPQTRRNIRTAESALRRAAFSFVIHSPMRALPAEDPSR